MFFFPHIAPTLAHAATAKPPSLWHTAARQSETVGSRVASVRWWLMAPSTRTTRGGDSLRRRCGIHFCSIDTLLYSKSGVKAVQPATCEVIASQGYRLGRWVGVGDVLGFTTHDSLQAPRFIKVIGLYTYSNIHTNATPMALCGTYFLLPFIFEIVHTEPSKNSWTK